MSDPVPPRDKPDKFKVAFSFAGEQRDLVRRIAEAVEARLGRSTVFFDEWYEAYIAGDSHGPEHAATKGACSRSQASHTIET